MPELEGRDVVTGLQSMGFHLFPVSVAGGRKCPESTAQSTAHLGLQNRQQKGTWKSILSGLIDCPQTRQAEFARNTS